MPFANPKISFGQGLIVVGVVVLAVIVRVALEQTGINTDILSMATTGVLILVFRLVGRQFQKSKAAG